MSESTYTVLESLGGYQSICRGEREVKGKGRMTTYWLTGKDNSEYKLPSEDLALSASKHNFKWKRILHAFDNCYEKTKKTSVTTLIYLAVLGWINDKMFYLYIVILYHYSNVYLAVLG